MVIKDIIRDHHPDMIKEKATAVGMIIIKKDKGHREVKENMGMILEIQTEDHTKRERRDLLFQKDKGANFSCMDINKISIKIVLEILYQQSMESYQANIL